jgi:hypothetical protein
MIWGIMIVAKNNKYGFFLLQIRGYEKNVEIVILGVNF